MGKRLADSVCDAVREGVCSDLIANQFLQCGWTCWPGNWCTQTNVAYKSGDFWLFGLLGCWTVGLQCVISLNGSAVLAAVLAIMMKTINHHRAYGLYTYCGALLRLLMPCVSERTHPIRRSVLKITA